MNSKAKYLKVYGILDQYQGEHIYSSVFNSILQGKTTFVVDLEHVPLVDNTGLSLLLTALKAARNAGGEIHLTAVSRPAHHFLESKCLASLFKLTDRTMEAFQIPTLPKMPVLALANA